MMNETVTVKPLINPVMWVAGGGQLLSIQVLRFFLCVGCINISYRIP